MKPQHERQVAGGGSVSGSLTAHVLMLLHVPHTLDELRLDLRVPRRDVEAAVESLRLEGHAIVGGNDGLHLTSDPDELERYVEARRRRLVTIYLGSRALRKTARRMREATDLTLWGAAA